MVDFVKKTEVRRFPPTHGKRFRATVSRIHPNTLISSSYTSALKSLE
jgi:hypothetical protein